MGIFWQPWHGCKDKTQAMSPLVERRSGYEWGVGRRLAQGVLVARMHSGGKGRSGSSRPNVSEAPVWSEQDKTMVEGLIVELGVPLVTIGKRECFQRIGNTSEIN